MAGEKAGESYLLVDLGHVLTHAAYLARVEGTARLVAVAEASTTGRTGNGELLEGVRRATANLELLIGRHILDPAGEVRRPSDPDGHGVDGVVLSASLAQPLRVALIGLTRDLSLASGFRAATLPFVRIERTICLETSVRRWEASDLEALLADPPDAVILVGGADGGPVTAVHDIGEMLSAAYSVLPPRARPAVIYAGNVEAQRSLAASFAGVADLRLAANVRPSARKENLSDLRLALGALFQQQTVGGSAQLQRLRQWAGTELAIDLDLLARTLRFMVRRHGLSRGVLGIDLGGNGTRVLRVCPQAPALTWTSPYGTGVGLAALRALEDPVAIVRWMHHPISWAEAWDRLSNMEVRPTSVPQTDEDWDLQQAAAREAMQRTWTAAIAGWSGYPEDGCRDKTPDMVVARGTALNHAHTPGQAALALIDALELTGVSRLTLDWANLLPGLAGLARLNPQAAVEVLDYDGLMELGTLVAPAGQAAQGKEALKVRMNVRGETRAELTVPGGTIRCLPLGVNERARLEIHPARGLDLGLGQPGRAVMAEVRGGALGIIVDARGRPLPVPRDEVERRRRLAAWHQEIEEQ